jgi:5,10-methylenetetrahydromethanopterin reductase
VTTGLPELWALNYPHPRSGLESFAAMIESIGFTGLLVPDTQLLSGDPFVGLTLAARATDRLLLGTGVTNPITRDPSVTASAISTVHVESGGRAVLGIGRGDTSLFLIGRQQPSVTEFGAYVSRVREYLSGADAVGERSLPGIQWMRHHDLPPIPIHLTATGPRAISLAATLGDGVNLALGADLERLRAAIDLIHATRRSHGLSPEGFSIGAYVAVVCHPEIALARRIARGVTSVFAHYLAMAESMPGVGVDDRNTLRRLEASYDLTRHGSSSAPQGQELDDDFFDRFAIVGPADHCVRRLMELVDLGIDRLVIGLGSSGVPRAEVIGAVERFGTELLPLWRSTVSTSEAGG